MPIRCSKGSRRRPPKTGSCVRHEDVKRRKSSKKCKYARNSRGYCMTKREYDGISKRKGTGVTPSLPNDIWEHIMDMKNDLRILEDLVQEKAIIIASIAKRFQRPPVLDLMNVSNSRVVGAPSTEYKSRLIKELSQEYPVEAKDIGKREAKKNGLQFVDNF